MPLLVRTPKPFATESLLGFVLRLCELNGYETPRYAWDLAEVPRGAELAPRLPVEGLAAILGQPTESLRGIAYRLSLDGRGSFKILGHSLGDDLRHTPLRLRRPAFCPQCLAEQGYLDAFWDLSVAVACPVHRCEVIRSCPACRNAITWKRPGLLWCPCGGALIAARYEAVAPDLSELMEVIRARLHGHAVGSGRSASGLPLDLLSSMPFSSLVHLLSTLGEQAVTMKGTTTSRDGPAISEAASLLADWPNGFHRFLFELGGKSLTEKPAALGLRKQFAGFYRATFLNRTFSVHAGWIREEFLRFGQHHWGQATVDPKFYRGGAPEPGRFLPMNTVARRYRIWKPVMTRMIADGTLVTTQIRSRKALRVMVDLKRSRLPQESAGILTDREAGRALALPVSVLWQLRKIGAFATGIRRGHVNSWHLDDVEAFRQRAAALPVAEASDGRAVVCLRNLMRLKFRDAKAKAEIVAAAFDGRLAVRGRGGDRPGDILLDQLEAETFILETRRKVLGDTYSFPQCARLTGLCASAVANAMRRGLLKAKRIHTQPRITAASVERFNLKYVPLAVLARRVGSCTKGLSRMCCELQLPVVSIPRLHGRVAQPVVCREVGERLIERWESQQCSRKVRTSVATLLRLYLEQLVATGRHLPRSGARPNLSAISRACGFARNAFYCNPSAVSLLAEFDSEERQRIAPMVRNPIEVLGQYVERLRDAGEDLPRWGYRPNKLAIAKACGIERDVFYKDAQALMLLNAYPAPGRYPQRPLTRPRAPRASQADRRMRGRLGGVSTFRRKPMRGTGGVKSRYDHE